MRHALFVTLVLLAGPALALDVAFAHAGRLLDASDHPVDASSLALRFGLYESEAPLTNETTVWEETYTVTVSDGLYAVTLGGPAGKALPASVFPPGSVRWLQVTVDGAALTPRQAIGTVPLAAKAFSLDCVGCIATGQLADGAVVDAKIAGVSATKLVGLVQDAQLAGLAASKLTGEITNAQIESLATSKLTGEITNGQIESLATTKLTGLLTSDQIQGLATSKLEGQVQDEQIAGLSSTKLSGAITSGQIANLSASKITGTIDGSQIGSLSANKVTGTLTNDQIASLDAAKLTGLLALDRLPTIPTSKLAGAGATLVASTAPASPATGATYYDTTTRQLRLYDGTTWVALATASCGVGGAQTSPAASCQAVKTACPGVGDGAYWIDLDGSGSKPAFNVWCDMTTAGGGWMIVHHDDVTNARKPRGTPSPAPGWNIDYLGTTAPLSTFGVTDFFMAVEGSWTKTFLDVKVYGTQNRPTPDWLFSASRSQSWNCNTDSPNSQCHFSDGTGRHWGVWTANAACCIGSALGGFWYYSQKSTGTENYGICGDGWPLGTGYTTTASGCSGASSYNAIVPTGTKVFRIGLR